MIRYGGIYSLPQCSDCRFLGRLCKLLVVNTEFWFRLRLADCQKAALTAERGNHLQQSRSTCLQTRAQGVSVIQGAKYKQTCFFHWCNLAQPHSNHEAPTLCRQKSAETGWKAQLCHVVKFGAMGPELLFHFGLSGPMDLTPTCL